jgi:pimeloyl-ACP methyl ester carboxylesterase
MSASGGTPPLALAKLGYFFVGGKVEEVVPGRPMVGQMYVEVMLPAEPRHPYPIVMVHGGFQTGTNFTGTPDGREGWAQYFVRRGYGVYIVDQVARGRSPDWNAHHGPVEGSVQRPLETFENRFTAPAAYASWPQAKLHTQFPGSGRMPDPLFAQFHASQYPSLASYPKQQELNRNALVALFERIGPAILLTHSQSGAFGWTVADAHPELVKAIVAMEPNGPPVRAIIDGLQEPEWYRDEEAEKPYGLSVAPLTYEPPVTAGAPLRFVRQDNPDKPDLVRCWMQAEPAAKLPRLAGIPIGIFVCEASYHAAYDHCTSAYLSQAGVEHDFIRLEDLGIRGNGHMMMLEKNSDEIALVIAEWIERKMVTQSPV